jgi:UDP-N-acetylglucosamine/UDP-N-acetylgalactosamine 4-epimerase
MSAYEKLKRDLRSQPKKWLVTGVGGFIGSNILETLLKLDQQVIGLDNFATGHKKNLQQVETLVGPKRWANFQFIEGDIRKFAECKCACHDVDYVLHQAALGSVPRSILEPMASHDSNVTGFLNMLVAARDAKAKRFVYASSSAIFGDHPELPKVEEKVGNLLSPYAATKKINEIYADVFGRAYNFESVGLRYFNVFGPRQDPEGAYAAVIPKWIAALLKREPVLINGDGETSRDFCFVENVVQANLLAASTTNREAINQAYNIACGERTTLNELFALLQSGLRKLDPSLPEQKPVYQDFRDGDVRHSLADIGKAKRFLGYEPTHQIGEGLEMAMGWYKQNVS